MFYPNLGEIHFYMHLNGRFSVNFSLKSFQAEFTLIRHPVTNLTMSIFALPSFINAFAQL